MAKMIATMSMAYRARTAFGSGANELAWSAPSAS
jgi:hypothetical protein